MLGACEYSQPQPLIASPAAPAAPGISLLAASVRR